MGIHSKKARTTTCRVWQSDSTKIEMYMSVLEHTTDMENIDDTGPVDERCATTDKIIVHVHVHAGEITSVLSFERYLSCPECKSKVHKVDDICGQCMKCGGAVKLTTCICPKNMHAKVKLEDNQRKIHFATMFTKVILSTIKTEAVVDTG